MNGHGVEAEDVKATFQRAFQVTANAFLALRWPHLKEFETNHHLRAGGWNPRERLKDLAFDGTSAEVLFPTQGVDAWRSGDVELEQACMRVYNDYLIDFCRVAPERFWGLAMISLWDIDHAITELERCRNEGLRGATIWIAPPAELPYSDPHYERFWDATQALKMPLAMHILRKLVDEGGQDSVGGPMPSHPTLQK